MATVLASFREIVEALSSGAAWPDGEPPEVRATHASVVLLKRDRVYKLKRPVDLGFLDYGTPERRRHMCEEEVRLNAPRAPGVYLGVRPIVAAGDGFRIGGPGEPLEWAVEMVRLPDAACLLHRVEAGFVRPDELRAIGRRIAELHAAAPHTPAAARWASLAQVGRLALENLESALPEVGLTIHPRVHERLDQLFREALGRLGPRIEVRARERAREIHGDLRLDHVYLLGPERILLVDGIEFSERLRSGDPVCDLAFLTMDLGVRGHEALADALAEGWLARSGDEEARSLLGFYEAYRSAVRAKVAGILLRDPDLPAEAREAAVRRAARHWLWALGALEAPARRPCLVGVGGLPGTGKTTLARALAHAGHFDVIRSDVVRRALDNRRVRYTERAKDRVYEACLAEAAAGLQQGRRVIVDATFSRERWRERLRACAREHGVPAIVLECRAEPGAVRDRLARRRGDASEATVAVYERAARAWEPGDTVPIASDDPERAVVDAIRAIAQRLAPPRRRG